MTECVKCGCKLPFPDPTPAERLCGHCDKEKAGLLADRARAKESLRDADRKIDRAERERDFWQSEIDEINACLKEY